MKLLTSILFYAFLGTFSQSLLFSNGIGIDLALRTGKWPLRKWMTAALITGFSLLSVPEMALIRALKMPDIWTVPLLAVFEGLVCLLAVFYLRLRLKRSNARLFMILQSVLPMAAFSNLVILVGISAQWRTLNVTESVGYAFGTGLSFLLTLYVLEEAIHRIGNEDLPESFIGLPSLLIYFGILSMAVIGFSGSPLMFG